MPISGLRYEIEFAGLTELGRRVGNLKFAVLNQLPRIIENSARECFVEEIVNYIQTGDPSIGNGDNRLGPINYTGTLADAIRATATLSGGNVELDVSVDPNEVQTPEGLNYAEILVSPMEPREIGQAEFDRLLEWVVRKLQVPQESAYAVANSIKNNIEEQGQASSPRPFFEFLIRQNSDKFRRSVSEGLESAVTDILNGGTGGGETPF